MVYACNCCCRSRGFVEAYRDLLELVCEACNVIVGSQVWRHVNCASVSSYEEIACIPKHHAGRVYVGMQQRGV